MEEDKMDLLSAALLWAIIFQILNLFFNYKSFLGFTGFHRPCYICVMEKLNIGEEGQSLPVTVCMMDFTELS